MTTLGVTLQSLFPTAHGPSVTKSCDFTSVWSLKSSLHVILLAAVFWSHLHHLLFAYYIPSRVPSPIRFLGSVLLEFSSIMYPQTVKRNSPTLSLRLPFPATSSVTYSTPGRTNNSLSCVPVVPSVLSCTTTTWIHSTLSFRDLWPPSEYEPWLSHLFI